MTIGPEASSLVETIQNFSQNKLRRSADLAVLIDQAYKKKKEEPLSELSFLAKFIWNTFTVMKRIGKGSEGYDKLSFQFNENIEKASTLLRLIMKESPDDIKQRFVTTYFAKTAEGFQSLLDLLHDLSWLKNWQIDHPSSVKR
jgi:hypothetical protein